MPVQAVYKFTDKGDDRRIIAGRIESGNIKVGDKVVFLPSNKYSTISSIEEFNTGEPNTRSAGYSTGFTLKEQIYVHRGNVMCKAGEDDSLDESNEKFPCVSSLFKAHIFWMGKSPLVKDKEYKLKIHTTDVSIKIKEIVSVINASDLTDEIKENNKVERHEVAECIIECNSAIAFDLSTNLQNTSRFVIVDEYDIAGGGIITKSIDDSQANVRQQVFLREEKWDQGLITSRERGIKYSQVPKMILLTGKTGIDKKTLAKSLEKTLFDSGNTSYFLGIGNLLRGLDSDIDKAKREEHIRRLGEVAHIMLDAGLIVVSTASDLSDSEIKLLRTIIENNSLIIGIIGKNCHSEKVDFELEEDNDDKVDVNLNKILNFLKTNNLLINRIKENE